MCKYCLDKGYNCNTYDLKGPNNSSAEIHLSLDEEDLLIEAEWNDYFRSSENKPVKMGFIAKAMIRYCPWCGRKLKGDYNNDYNYSR